MVRKLVEYYKKKITFTFGENTGAYDKQDPEKRKAFKEKLAEYINIAKTSPDKLQIWFWDESGFSLRVIRRKAWGKKGKRKKIAGQRSRGRVNVMGGLRYTDKKRVNYFIKKGNADTFYESLKMLNELVKKEWVEQGNQLEDFEQLGQNILIILDNASFHKRKDILSKIESDLPKIRLEFLPAYSPDYNLIELVWHSAKEYIAHKTFESVEQLENLLNKLLNEGQLIIKWERKIKNKGNSIY